MAKRRPTSRRKPKRLDVAAAGILPATVPKRWVKFLVGFFLLFPCLVLTQTFFTAFAHEALDRGFWRTEEFWFFSLGAVLWLGIFFGLPRKWPLIAYIFGHEVTHAIWVILHGGKVHQFRVSRTGGHILADRTNTIIALAPYFFPIYSVLVIVIYGVCSIFWDMTPHREWLYAFVGATWAYHLSFTCWMVPKGQPDLHYGGTFFSLTVIYLLNLLILSVLLILASPEVGWLGFGRELLQNAVDLTATLTLLVNHLIREFHPG